MEDEEPASLDRLGEDVIQRIALHLSEDVQDLLRLSRVSRRCHCAVHSADVAWQVAYSKAFGQASDQLEHVERGDVEWIELYKQRYLADLHGARQLAAARRLRATSTAQGLRQEVLRLQEALKKEQKQHKLLTGQLSTLQHAREATKLAPAHQYWVPVAVMKPTGLVVEQTPLDTEEREKELAQDAAVSRLEVNKLTKMLDARRQALRRAEAKLQALQP